MVAKPGSLVIPDVSSEEFRREEMGCTGRSEGAVLDQIERLRRTDAALQLLDAPDWQAPCRR